MKPRGDRGGAAPRGRRLPHALGRRLVLVFLLLALALAGTFLVGMQRALSGGFEAVVRPLLADYVDRLAAEIGSPPDPARARALAERLPLSVHIEGPSVQWDSHPSRRAWARRHDGWLFSRTTADGHRITFGLGDVGWTTRPRAIGWVTLGLLLAFTALAYGYVRRLLRPLDDIRAGAQRFGSGVFDEAIPVRRHDELGELAGRINHMAAELEGMLDAKRALLLSVSHELRSPLTRARLNAELVADGAPREALLRDLAEMRDLIDDLLEGERLAGGHAALHTEPTDLNALVRALVAERHAAARIRLELAPSLPAAALDPSRVRLLLRNLIDNALRAGADPPPTVRTAVGGDGLHLAVRDFGPGVDEAVLPKLGQPFYRPDAARQRGTGGVGLGLYLCRLVAEAHGGELALRNAQPGFEAEVTLPLRG